MKGEQQDMETTAEQLIRDKGYEALSPEELVVVHELCDSEEEFQSMKQFFREMDQLTLAQKTVVSPAIKESLDSIFAAKHPGIRANWSAPIAAEAPREIKVVPLYQRKWARIAAVLVLALGTIPFWLMMAEKENLSTVPAVQTARNIKHEKALSGKQSLEAAPDGASEESSPVIDGKSVASDKSVRAVMTTNSVSDEMTAAVDSDMIVYSRSAAPALIEPTDVPAKSVVPVMTSGVTATSPSMFGFTSASGGIDPESGSGSAKNFGMLADLNPEGRSRFQLSFIAPSPLSASLDQQPDELLDLLVPAF